MLGCVFMQLQLLRLSELTLHICLEDGALADNFFIQCRAGVWKRDRNVQTFLQTPASALDKIS